MRFLEVAYLIIGGTAQWKAAVTCGMAYGQKQHSENVVGKQLDGPIFLFGASVEYLPITVEDKSGTHQLGTKNIERDLLRL